MTAQESNLKELKYFARELGVLAEGEFIIYAENEYILAKKKQNSARFSIIFEGKFEALMGFMMGINYNRKRVTK